MKIDIHKVLPSILMAAVFILPSVVASAQEEETKENLFPLVQVWSYNAPQFESTFNQQTILNTPVADELRIFFTSSNGSCGAIFKRTGEISWTFNYNKSFNLGLLIYPGKVLVTACSDRIFAFNPENGLVLWHKAIASQMTSTIAQAGDALIAADTNGRIYCLDAEYGSLKWQTELGSASESQPLVAEGRIFIGDEAGFVHCLDLGNGKSEWKYEVGSPVRSGFALYEKHLFFGAKDNYFYSINADDGSRRWRTRTAGDINGVPFCNGKTVYISSSDRTLRAFHVGNGHTRRNSPVQLTSNLRVPPVVIEDQLIFPLLSELVGYHRVHLNKEAGFTAPGSISTGVLLEPDQNLLIFGCTTGQVIAVAPQYVIAKLHIAQDRPDVLVADRPDVAVAEPETEEPAVETEEILQPAEDEAEQTAEETLEPAQDEEPPAEETTEPSQEEQPVEETTEPEEEAETVEPPVVEEIPETEESQEELPDTTESAEEIEVEEEVAETSEEQPEPTLSPAEALTQAQAAVTARDFDLASRLWRVAMADRVETTYTVTVGLFCQMPAIHTVLDHAPGEAVMVFDRQRGDTTCYFICIGMFDTREEAEAYIYKLDDLIQRQNPTAHRLDSFIP